MIRPGRRQGWLHGVAAAKEQPRIREARVKGKWEGKGHRSIPLDENRAQKGEDCRSKGRVTLARGKGRGENRFARSRYT